MKNLRCLQLWMMLLMSNLVNYTRIFKTLQILIKTLSACGQHVLFLHCNMLYISIYIYIYQCSACWAEICRSHNKGTNTVTITQLKVILVMEFSFPSLNDTARVQWWWQLIMLECQQQFLWIWAAVPQSILACSSSGGGKRATEMRILCFSDYWKMRQ